MSTGIRLGVSNVAHTGVSGFVGVNNVARNIAKIYVGVDGVAQLGYTTEPATGEIVFTSSGTWTVPEGATSIDIFCVGGGGGAGGSFYNRTVSGTPGVTGSETETFVFGSAGSSGETKTQLGVVVSPRETLSIYVGAGGAGGSSASTTGTVTSFVTVSNGGEGEVSRVTTPYGIDICRANGGRGGTAGYPAATGSGVSDLSYYAGHNGVKGGSGSGAGGSCSHKKIWENGSLTSEFSYMYCAHGNTANDMKPYGEDGVDGSDGGYVDKWQITYVPSYSEYRAAQLTNSGGTGQNRTTRKWGQGSETLYSQIGIQTPNSGNSGPSGSHIYPYQLISDEAKSGSSGVVIIKVNY